MGLHFGDSTQPVITHHTYITHIPYIHYTYTTYIMGKKLNLAVDRVVSKQERGEAKEFQASNLNVMLAFQVNCPGCFLYALPLMNRLHDEFTNRGVYVFALSTAFEEFDLNTVEATEKLVQKGEIYGATRRALGSEH